MLLMRCVEDLTREEKEVYSSEIVRKEDDDSSSICALNVDFSSS